MKFRICSSISFGTLLGILGTVLLSWTLNLHLLIFLFFFSTCRTILYSCDVFYREEQLGSLYYPLIEISLISSDKEILSRSYQNPFLFVAILSEALAGFKEKELSTLLTIINSHSELPLLLRILLPSLKDITSKVFQSLNSRTVWNIAIRFSIGTLD